VAYTVSIGKVRQAARNNALWCDAVCRAHCKPGEFRPAAWVNRHPAPRFHSNLVTLGCGEAAADQLAGIRELMAGGLAGPWTIKDSFNALALGPLGFVPLFKATWLWRDPSLLVPGAEPQGVRWAQVRKDAELRQWEAAWNGDPADGLAMPMQRQFMPPLLADRDIVFIAALRDDRIVAGAVANRTGRVVGLSNIFLPLEDSLGFRAGCVAMAQERYPGLPMVGYERGAALISMQALGFKRLQPLTVWITS
jgi:hypothetical protein